MRQSPTEIGSPTERLAKTMYRQDVAMLLVEILEEEKEADLTLTGVAENNINVEAESEA